MRWFLFLSLSLISFANATIILPQSDNVAIFYEIAKNTSGPIIAIHEHVLRPDINPIEYEKTVQLAIEQLEIPGLLKAFHLKGFKGTREGKYSVIWVFANQQVLEDNFGTSDNPRLPESWLYYENDVLAQFIVGEPDKIVFTDYKVMKKIAWPK